MSIYARLKRTADRLIENYGSEYTFTTVVQGAFDPATGSPASTTSSTYTAYAVRDQFSKLEMANASVQVDDIKLIASVAAFMLDDTVSMDGEIYRLVSIEPIKPGATVVAYQLQLRK